MLPFALVLLACNSTKPAEEAPPDKPEAKAAAPAEPTAPPQKTATGPALERWDFDGLADGAAPEGFDLLETASVGRPATWGGAKDPQAPSGGTAFGVLETTNEGQTYNLALAPGFESTDVELTVAVKARTGKQDQGGGVAFRADGASNYYIARWNPLEKNVRFYVVVNQQRSAFAAADIDLDPSRWHTMRVIAEGNRFELFMDETSVLVTNDDTLGAKGRIGLWTKADAATLFDDLTAQAL